MERIEEIMELEKEGISKTIIQYTRDNFVKSYAEQFVKCEYPKDKKLIKLLADRLVIWYRATYSEIKNGQYVLDKERHQYTYRLVREIRKLLKDVVTD